MGERELRENSDRRTQSDGLRSLSEGSEIEDLTHIPDPTPSDRANLKNSKRRRSILGFVFLAALFPMVAILSLIAGEMIAVLLFCIFLIPIILLGLMLQ